jgi:hypothetical protein
MKVLNILLFDTLLRLYHRIGIIMAVMFINSLNIIKDFIII